MARNISWEPASINIQTAASMVAVGKLKKGFGLLNHTQVRFTGMKHYLDLRFKLIFALQ
jgi:hypothetical protein